MTIDREQEIRELESQIEHIKSARFAPGFGKETSTDGKAEQIAELERKIGVHRQLMEKEKQAPG